MDPQQFIYQPLTGADIRLVKFKPEADSSGAGELQLVHFDVKDAPPFLALSYVWGDPEITRPLTVNSQTLHVTTNLFDAVVQIGKIAPVFEEGLGRGKESGTVELFLWIDAICIDQRNTDERSKQVLRMAQIFSSAFTVLIWLGKREILERTPPVAFGWLIQVFQKISLLVEFSGSKDIMTLPPEWSEHYLAKMMVLVYTEILGNEWFERMWVVQEYTLSQRKPCALLGDALFSFQALYDFRQAVLLLKEYPDELMRNSVGELSHVALIKSSQAFGSTYLRDRIATKEFQEMSLAKQFLSIRMTQVRRSCTVLHDNIYGLLGLIDLPQLSQDLMPDYRKPWGDICKAYAKVLIEQTQDLRLMMFGHQIEGAVDLKQQPSWVPDFRSITAMQAEPATRHSGSFSADGESLTVKGTRLGRVQMYFNGAEGTAKESMQQFNDTLITTAAELCRRPVSQVWKEWFATFLFEECNHSRTHAERFPSAMEFINDSPTEDPEDTGEDLIRGWIFVKFSCAKFCLIDTGEIHRFYGRSLSSLGTEILVFGCRGATQASVVCPDDFGTYKYMGWLGDRDLSLDEAFFEERQAEQITLV